MTTVCDLANSCFLHRWSPKRTLESVAKRDGHRAGMPAAISWASTGPVGSSISITAAITSMSRPCAWCPLPSADGAAAPSAILIRLTSSEPGRSAASSTSCCSWVPTAPARVGHLTGADGANQAADHWPSRPGVPPVSVYAPVGVGEAAASENSRASWRCAA